MARKSGKAKKTVSTVKKTVMPVKKTAKKGKKEEKKKNKEKKPVIVPHEFRTNIRCRYCFFVDGYTGGEKICHNCKKEIYEVDKI
ncbi:MAG: hypothetical protein ABII89_04360 [Candidatus Omnitrophota bacterium]